ncbi:MAG: hypothetical protein CMB80_08305 [Flammeovirgaceae bacterium]|nr:hypothetical protein [Flammeovirgaceae bacterium]MBR06349.1 hypothetical protein [Rickettsiales bacterium]HCX22512.1 hypothetical protein [Cytophagales bacterium]
MSNSPPPHTNPLINLSRETERIKNIANNIKGAILRYKVNEDGSEEMLYVSDGIQELYELTVEEAMSNVDRMWDPVWNEDLQEFKQSVSESAENLTHWDFTWRITTPSGITKYVHGRGTPFRVEDGTVWDTVIVDVTGRVKSEKKLQRTIKEEALILETIPESFFSIKPDWRIGYWNWGAANLTGIAKDQVIGNDIRKVLEVQHQELLEQIKYVKIKRRQAFTEMMVNDRVCSVSVHYSEGIVLCIIEDITDKKTNEGQMLEKLIQAQELERNRISRTLHDGIVQQLVSLNMRVNHLEELLGFEHQLFTEVHQIKSQIKSITSQVREVSHQLQTSDIVNASLQELCLRLYEQVSLNREVKFDFQMHIELANVDISDVLKTHIFRILQELTNNILKHSKATLASVVLDEIGDHLYLTVSDNGTGLDATSGRGIGLSNIQDRVRLMKGNIEMNNSESGGFEVSIIIPFKTDSE